MKTYSPVFRTTLLSLAAAVGFGNNSHAAVSAYEGFDYAAGTAAGTTAGGSPLNGGTGWSGGWYQATSPTGVTLSTVSPGLSYQNLMASGNAFNGGGSPNLNGPNLNTFRALSSAIDLTSGDVWVSLIGLDHQAGGRIFALSLYSGTTTSGLDIGHTTDPTHLNWGLTTGGVNSTYQSSSTLATTESFLLVNINAGVASLWVNPNLSLGQAGLGGADASITLSETFTSFDNIRLFGGGLNSTTSNGYGEGLFDEIRIGSSFADVAPIPEPTSFAFLALGFAAWTANRRRVRL